MDPKSLSTFVEDGASERIGKQRNDRIRLLLIGCFFLFAFAGAYSLNYPSVSAIRSDVSRIGFFAPVIFIGIYTLATLFFVPKNVLSIAAGAVFGLLPGISYVLVGATAGSVVAFFGARGFGRSSIERLAGQRVSRLDARLAGSPFLGILIARLIPIVPFTLLNFAAGLSGVAFAPYLGATVIGMLPGTASYVALGAYGTNLRSWEFALAVLVFVGFWILTRRLMRKNRD